MSTSTIDHWIDGRAMAQPDADVKPVRDPATGRHVADLPIATPDVVDMAVSSARAAAATWGETSLGQRQHLMFSLRERLEAHRDELASRITAEHGKTLADAAGEVRRGIEVVEYACALPELLKGEHSAQVSTDVDMFSRRHPLGVVAGITPFNFPVMVPMWMFPMAIACGNTFVLKPSERDPSPSMLLAELVDGAGFPPGVFNVVHGDAVTVNALLDHDDVDAVSFVGSTDVARHVHDRASASGKRVQALGGAKNHLVVLPDADPVAAADAAISAGFGSAGERCMAISVVVAVAAAADRLVAELAPRIDALTVGPGGDEGVDMGPLITAEHRDRVAGYIEAGERAGATVLADGRGVAVPGREDGYFLGPTLFDHVRPDMSIYTDEIFGPVLCIVRVEDLDGAIALVNANRWGNGTAIFTRDGAAARTFEARVEVGMVGINVPIPVPMSFYSFGGWKDSMFGDHDVYGPGSIDFHTRTKKVISRWRFEGSRDLAFGGT